MTTIKEGTIYRNIEETERIRVIRAPRTDPGAPNFRQAFVVTITPDGYETRPRPMRIDTLKNYYEQETSDDYA